MQQQDLTITTSFLLRLQKWSKGKVRDKLNNLILFDKATYDKLYKEVPSYKLITPSVVSERLKVRGSLAKAGLRELHSKGRYSLRESNCIMRKPNQASHKLGCTTTESER